MKSCAPSPGNSPNCPVGAGADRPQRRVSLRDVPRRFLDLQSVKTRSDREIVHLRIHDAVLFQLPVGVLVIKRLQPWSFNLTGKISQEI